DTLIGGGSNDILFGEEGNDTLQGGTGKDVLYGQGGNDNLQGGGGSDVLVGSSGADMLTGGIKADTFLFNSAAESTVDPAGMDTIADLSRSDGDKIDLKGVDANDDNPGNNVFTFIGRDQFTGDAGELRYARKSGDNYVYGDT